MNSRRRICHPMKLLCGSPTTVGLHGNGRGGKTRPSQLALAAVRRTMGIILPALVFLTFRVAAVLADV
jgi:glycerate-2-kinase